MELTVPALPVKETILAKPSDHSETHVSPSSTEMGDLAGSVPDRLALALTSKEATTVLPTLEATRRNGKREYNKTQDPHMFKTTFYDKYKTKLEQLGQHDIKRRKYTTNREIDIVEATPDRKQDPAEESYLSDVSVVCETPLQLQGRHVNETATEDPWSLTSPTPTSDSKEEPALHSLCSFTPTGTVRCNYSNEEGNNTLFIWEGKLNDSGKRPITFMYDSGASSNFVSDSFVRETKLPTYPLPSHRRCQVKVADGTTYPITRLVHIPVDIKGYKTIVHASVIPMTLDVNIVLGTPWIKSINEESDLSVNAVKRTLSFENQGRKVVLHCKVPIDTPTNLVNNHFDIISAEQAAEDLKYWNRQSNNKHDAFWISNLLMTQDDTTSSKLSKESQTLLLQVMQKAEVKSKILAAEKPSSTMEKYAAKVVTHWNQIVAEETGKIKKTGAFETHDDDPDEVEDWPEVQHYRDKLLQDFADVLAESLPPLKNTTHPPSRIRLQPGKENDPPFKKAYRMSSSELEALRKQLDELLEKGYIRPSASPYGAPVLMVPKPHQPGKLRLVIDYRGINQITVRDRYPLPNVDSMFDQLQGAKVFSTLDALWGFWQLPVLEEDIEKTSMVTQFGSYEWVVLPMGLTNSPSTFQRVLSSYLMEAPEHDSDGATDLTRPQRMNEFVRVFIDDVLVFSKTEEQHYEHLIRLLTRLRQVKFIMKGSKAQLFRRKVKFLGHVLTNKGVHPQHAKCKAVQEWPEPKNGQQIRQFLGLVGYYRKYIRHYADLARPLFDCLKADRIDNFEMTEPIRKAFYALKAALSSPPLLVLPDQLGANNGTRPYLVVTDVSQVAIGGVLMQDQGQGYQPIAYESKALSPAEQNYNTTERELLGIVHCTKVWKHYLQGASYLLQSDHKPLESLFSPNKDLTRRQARWIEHLVEVGVHQVTHVPGKTIPVPDAFSRRPGYVESSPAEGLAEQFANQDFQRMDTEMEPEQAPQMFLQTLHLIVQLPSRPPEDEELNEMSVMTRAMRRSHTRKDGDIEVSIGCHAKDYLSSSSTPTKTSPRTKPTLLESRKDDSPLVKSRKDALTEPSTKDIQSRPQLKTSQHEAHEASNNDESTKEQLASPEDSSTHLPDPTSKLEPPDVTTEYPGIYNHSRRLPLDNQNWMFRPDAFKYWNTRVGPFQVDACCDKEGKNSHCPQHWSKDTPPTLEYSRFKGKRWEYKGVLAQKADGKRLWINFPFNDKSQPAQTFRDKLFNWLRDARTHAPLTSALIIIPEWITPSAASLHKWNIQALEVYPKGSHLFASPGKTTLPTRWDVYVLWMPPNIPNDVSSSDKPTTWITMQGCDFLETLRTALQQDAETAKIIRRVQQEDPVLRDKYKMIGNLLWRKQEGHYQFVIPSSQRSLQQVVLSQTHDVPAAGHLGTRKTLERVKRHFYWKTMQSDVEHYCKHCNTCLSTKTSAKVNTAKRAIQTPERKWEVVTMDFVTGLPLTDRGNDAIATFTDKLTKMVHLVPLHWNSSSSHTIARIFFESVWRLHGCPLKIICDRDTRMASATWLELMRLVGIKTAATTPYRPQSDGQSEVTNKVMEQILRAYIEPRQKDWDIKLPAVEFAMNDSEHSVTRFTPFYLNYGQSPATNLDILLDAVKQDCPTVNPTASELIDQMQQDLSQAKQNIQEHWQKVLARPSTNKHSPKYKIGDQVMLSTNSFTAPKDKDTQWKLRPKYYGPFSVVQVYYDDENYKLPPEERGPPSACKLGLPKGWKIHPTFSLDKIKPFPGESKYEHQNAIPPPPTEVVEGKDEYVVEKILDHKIMYSRGSRKKEMHWLIRWKGYGPEEDLWIPERNINVGGQNAVWRDYEEQRKNKERRQQQAHLNTVIQKYVTQTKQPLYEISSPIQTLNAINTNYFYSQANVTDTNDINQKICTRKTRTSNSLFHFAYKLSSSSSTVTQLSLARPQDFVVTVLHQEDDKTSSNVAPSEPFDHHVNLATWIRPNNECSIYQYSPHYFDFCWIKVTTTVELKLLSEVIKILSPKYWTVFDCTSEGLKTEDILKEDSCQKFNTPENDENNLQVITTMPIGKRLVNKIIKVKTISETVLLMIDEYFNLLRRHAPTAPDEDPEQEEETS